MLNPVIGGIVFRWALGILAGYLAAHFGVQVSQPEIDAVGAALTGVGTAVAAAAPVVLSVLNKKKLGAL